MAMNFDGILIDTIKSAVAEDFEGNLLYRLTQLSDASIDITADSQDITDKDGTLIKKFYKGKNGEFTATNALIDFNVWSATSGSEKQVATAEKTIVMPKILILDATTEVITLADTPIDGTVRVSAVATAGGLGKAYTKSTTASATAYALSTNKLTLPTDAGVAQYIVKYDYNCASGVKIDVRGNKFPNTVKLTLEVLVCDLCDNDVVRKAYIVFPSLQVSPETSLQIGGDSQTMDYKGTLQLPYCSVEKQLYYVVMSEDDIEE